MKSSILAHIASDFISEYENVANSSIAYLLNNYDAARNALKILINNENIPHYFITELATDNHGRPDVTGLDQDGNKIIIVEGKFWASLTENQPCGYLEEITDDGCVLFLAPDKRIHSLKIEIAKRIKECNDNGNVQIHSWTEFLDLIDQENIKNFNESLASDLHQIKELCKKMDVEGMPPLSASDLDPMNGRLLSNFSDLIDECNFALRKWEHTDFKNLKTTPQKYGYGFYFRCFRFGCFLGFDAKKWFLRNNQTPIWLSIYEENWKKSLQISHYLSDFDPANSFDNEYGIILNTGMDKEQLVTHIVDKVKEVLIALESKMQ